MRIALCLHGYFANAGGSEASRNGFEYIKSKLLSKYDVDVFIHSWDLPNKDLALSLYSPQDYVFEKQYSFEEELLNFKEWWFLEGQKNPPGMYATNTIYRGLSFLFSRKRAVEIKKKFEEDNGFLYDCVILARFDLGQRGKEFPQEYYVTNIDFSDELDMEYLYSAFWNQLNHGFADHWFYSNSKNMDLVSLLYDKACEYYDTNSSYVKAVLEGWPDSNKNNEFSNEITKENKCTDLITFPKWGCIDNHKLYKWYFMDSGLYNKCRFVDITREDNEETNNIMYV